MVWYASMIGSVVLCALAAAGAAGAPAAPPLRFEVNGGGQVDGGRVLRHVPNSVESMGWRDNPSPPKDWALTRWEGSALYGFGWFALDWNPGNAWQSEPRWSVEEGGRYRFRPVPQVKQSIDQCLHAGLTPCVVMGTPNIPGPLIEGGFSTGQYGYQNRQPNDYARWREYLVSLFRWMADTYGRQAARNWTFMFGIEMDWQIKCVVPGTQTPMSQTDNQRECIKMLDTLIDAAEEVLGRNLYFGCYFAFPGQADAYIRHWAEGTNFANGERGTRIGWVGFSDWSVRPLDDYNPFAPPKREGDKPVAWTFTAGTRWKYDYLARLLDHYPQLRGVEVHLPEAGYFDRQGGTNAAGQKVPADTAYADFRGACLYAMRTLCYAECPRLVVAWNRYALSTNDLAYRYHHAVLPPVFHAIRIGQRLAGCRRLPVSVTGKPADASNDVRLLAAAADDGDNTLRLLVTNFSEDFHARKPEAFAIRVVGLPPAARHATVTVYRIDETHNNWWQDWIDTRKQAGVPYVAGPNSGHLGSGIRYHERYAPYEIDVWGTTDPKDWRHWMERSDVYRRAEALTPSEPSRTVPIRSGSLELSDSLPSLGTLLVEVTCPAKRSVVGGNLSFAHGTEGWQTQGDVKATEGRITIGAAGGTARRVFDRLSSRRTYTVLARARATARRMDYRLRLADPSGATLAECWGDRSATWVKLAATAVPNRRGRLAVCLEVPAQTADATDHVAFDDVAILGN